MAAAFIHSKLTPLFILASMALGALAVVALPREEEPQIIVPMVDVFVEMPGATPADVEQRVTRPMEQLLWEVPGVEYVYSTSSPGQSMVVVRFKVDEPQEAALVRLNQKLAANADRIPPGVIGPIVKPRSIDDVPILAVTVWSARYGDDQLRIARRPTARCHRRSQRRVGGDHHRRAAAAGSRGHRSGEAVGLRSRSAGGSAGDRPHQRARHRVGSGRGRPDDRPRGREPPAHGRRTARHRRHLRERASRARARRGRGRGWRCRAHVVCHLPVEGVRRATGGHHRRRQAQGHQRHRRRASRRREARHAQGIARAVGRASHHHPRLRRDRRRQEQRTAVAHAARRALGLGADLARARPARGGGRADRDSGHARAHALHVLSLRLHAEPHHALRADLLHRHPRGRCDRRGGEHRAARADERRRAERAGRRRDSRRGRSGQPDDPGDARRGGGDPADGVRRRPDGALHAADSGRRVGGDGLLARRRLRRDAVGGGAAAQADRASRPRRRGSPHAALSPRDGAAHRQRPDARDLPRRAWRSCCWRRWRSCRSSW